MSNKEEQPTNSNLGKIITMGSLNLFLNLQLEKKDLKSTNFNDIKGLEDLGFLTSNEKLWEKIELTSKNELIDTLFKMNRIKENKSVVAYLVLDKISWKEEQSQFQKLLDFVLLDNGLIIYSYEICKCVISINLKLIYKNKVKRFVIYGEKDYDDDEIENQNENEEKNEEEEKEKENKEEIETDRKKEDSINDKDENQKEEDANDLGPFKKIPEEEVKFDSFKYIYIHYKNFTSDGEFSSEFTKEQLYNFLKKLKDSCKIKIIFNFYEDFEKNQEYLIKFIQISDIHIFRNKNELTNILKKKLVNEELKKEKEKERMRTLFKTQKIQNNKFKFEDRSSSISNIKQNELNYSQRERFNSSIGSSFRKSMYKSQSYINLSKSFYPTFDRNTKTPLNKNNLYYYLQEQIFIFNYFEKHPNSNDKLGIYLDEFKKIFLVKYKKSSFIPNIIEYELKIYPKSNIYNLKEIENIKDLLMKDYTKYTSILNGCILNTIINDTDNYFMYYYYSRISLLKLLALEKNNMPIPKDKSFYIVKIDKKEFNKMLKEENTKKQENGFNNNHFQLKYRGNDCKYYPLMDKFLTSYMQSLVNINILKNKNLINEKKKILYDPEYKDIFKFWNNSIEDIDKKKFETFIMKKNISNNFNIKEKDYKKEYKNKKPEMKFHLPGINGVPEYIVYLSKEERKRLSNKKLPPIKPIKYKPKKEPEQVEEINMMEKKSIKNLHKKEKINEAQNKIPEQNNNLDNNKEENDNEKDKVKEEKKFNFDKYKEIKFQQTPAEANNLIKDEK